MIRWLAIWYFHLLSDVTPISPRTCFIRFVIFFLLLSDPLNKKKKKNAKKLQFGRHFVQSTVKKIGSLYKQFFSCLIFYSFPLLFIKLFNTCWVRGWGWRERDNANRWLYNGHIEAWNIAVFKYLIFMNNCERYEVI